MALSKPDVPAYMEEMLTCSVCLEMVTEPWTLRQCLHSYCQKCIQQLMDSQKNRNPGVICPICRNFSTEKEIRNNHFVKDLLYVHRTRVLIYDKIDSRTLCKLKGDEKNTIQSCGQCPDEETAAEASWKCLNCCMSLCGQCKKSHARIRMFKGHRFLELTKEAETVIDSLVFCSVHPDEPIKFYCNQCGAALCITCLVINHSGHNISTVQEALAELVPKTEEDLNMLDVSLQDIEHGVHIFDAELAYMERNYSQCSERVDEVIEERIQQLRGVQRRLKEKLEKDKQVETSTILDKKKQFLNKQKVLSNLKNVARTSLDRARNASLLTELVSGRVGQRLEEVRNEPRQRERLSVKIPRLRVNRSLVQEDDEGLVGEIVYSVDKVLVVDGGRVSTEAGGGYCGGIGNYREFFKKPPKQTARIVLEGSCFKVVVCDDKVYVPLYYNKVVQVYTVGGELVKSITTEGHPTSVHRTAIGEILVSCEDTGLYELNTDMSYVTIGKGNYTDACVCGEAVYTWDYNKKCIVKFVEGERGWTQVGEVGVGWLQGTSYLDTLLVRECGEDSSGLVYFIGLHNQHTVYQVNSEGHKVRQFSSESEQGEGGLCGPLLCGVDDKGQLLVADCGHHRYKVVDTQNGQWNTVFTDKSSVYDAKIVGENTVWLLVIDRGYKCVITKHEIV